MYNSNWIEIVSPDHAVGLDEALELAFFGQRVPITLVADGSAYSRSFSWDELNLASAKRLERALLEGEIWTFIQKDGKDVRVPPAYWDTWQLSDLPEARILMDFDKTYRNAPIFVDSDQIPIWKIIAERLTMRLEDGAKIECADAQELLVYEEVPPEWLGRLDEFAASREKAVLWTWLEALVWVVHRDLRQIGARALLGAWRQSSGRKINLPLISRIVASQEVGRDAERRLLWEILAAGVATSGRKTYDSRRERLDVRDWDGGAVQFNSTVDLGFEQNKLDVWFYDIAVDRETLVNAFPVEGVAQMAQQHPGGGSNFR